MEKEEFYNNLIKNTHEKISNCINNFILRDSLMFYGYFLLNVNFYETKKIKTAGVNFRNLKLNFYYNPDFVDSLSEKEVAFLVLHEIFHLLFQHPKRGEGYNHKLANVAMDWIINEIIMNDYERVSDFIPGGLMMDSNYKDKRIFELVYNWLNEKHQKWKEKYGYEEKSKLIGELLGENNQESNSDKDEEDDKRLSDGDKEKRERENEELGIDEQTRTVFENNCSNFDEHFWDDISDEVKKEIIKRHISDLKSRGLVTSDVEETLNKLIKKSENDYLKYLKRSVSFLKGFSKLKSIKKPNRKGVLGLKGKNKYSNEINCILDTSGSMSGDFDKVLSEIFKDDYYINLIQCDADVKSFIKIKSKNELNKMKIKGLGGTVLQPAVDYINSNGKINNNNLVILTDGYTDELNFSQSKNIKVLILSTAAEVPVKNIKNCRQFILKK